MRVGAVDGPRPMDQYESIGASMKQLIEQALGDEWDWAGRRALDFGCGAGRVLRHFAAEATVAEFWGCDLDEGSIRWLNEHLSPPFHAFVVDENPALALADEYVDVAWAMSVFTHVTDRWAQWLLELHRVLRPGGYLIATFMGSNMSDSLLGERWDEDCVGMNVIGAGRPWSEGGPWVFHSRWWLRAHWGRAFELVDLQPNEGNPGTHGYLVARKRPVRLTASDLERPEPGDERELAAARHNIEQLHAEDRRVREQLRAARSRDWPSRARAMFRRLAARH
jgi:SAM-dependent methyltransferase